MLRSARELRTFLKRKNSIINNSIIDKLINILQYNHYFTLLRFQLIATILTIDVNSI